MIQRMNRTSIAATIAAGCILLGGCSSSAKPGTQSTPPTTPASTSSVTSSASTGSQPAAKATTITIKNFGYTVSGTAAPGAKVSVTNNDSTAHTVTADSGATFDVTVDPGKTATFTAPDKAGTYKFHCTFHSNMHGTLKVGG